MPYDNPDAPEGVTTSAATDWYINPKSRFPDTRRWAPAVFVVIVVVVMLILWGVGRLTSSPPAKKSVQTYTYAITGAATATGVSYDALSGVVTPGTVTLPFSVTVKERSGDFFITAQSTKVGSITCTVTSHGSVVITNTVEGANNPVVCN